MRAEEEEEGSDGTAAVPVSCARAAACCCCCCCCCRACRRNSLRAICKQWTLLPFRMRGVINHRFVSATNAVCMVKMFGCELNRIA